MARADMSGGPADGSVFQQREAVTVRHSEMGRVGRARIGTVEFHYV
jgi:hypothetical protein